MAEAVPRWALVLVAAAVLFDALALLSLLPRLPPPTDSPFSILSVRGDVDARGRVAVIRTVVAYGGEGALFSSRVVSIPFHFNFTEAPLPVTSTTWRLAAGEGDPVFRDGASLEAVQALAPTFALNGSDLVEVVVFPDLRTGLYGRRAAFRVPPTLPPGGSVELARLRDLETLPQDAFGVNTVEGAPTSPLMRIEGVAVPTLLTLLLALLAASLSQDRAWLGRLGARWWSAMAGVLVLAIGARVLYGGTFHADLMLNNLRDVRFSQLLASGSDIAWVADSAYAYVVAIAFAAVGTHLSSWGAEGTAMMVSLALSLAHVLVLGLLGAAILGPRRGIAAAALLALLPVDILFGTAVRRDGMAALFTTLSLLLAVRGSRRGSRAHLYAAAASFGMTLFAVRPLVLLVLPWVAFLVAACGLGSREARGPVAFLVLAAALPAFALMLETMEHMNEAPVLGGMLLEAGYLASNAAWMGFYIIGGDHHTAIVTLLAALGLASLARRRPGAAASLAAFPLVLALFLTVHRVPIAYCSQHRHLVYLYPPLLLLAAEGAAEAWARWRARSTLPPWIPLAAAAGYAAAVHAAYLGGVLALQRCI